MTLACPHLQHDDITNALRTVSKNKHRTNLVAIFGRSDVDQVKVDADTWDVRRPTCELDLRSMLPAKATDDQRMVFLLDWTAHQLPADLEARFASGSIRRVSPHAQLANRFGARDVDSRLINSGLSRVVLGKPELQLDRVPGSLLTARDAQRRFLKAWAGLQLPDPCNLAQAIAALLNNDRGAVLASHAETHGDWRELAGELSGFFADRFAPLGASLFKAWLQNQVTRWLEILLLLDAHDQRGDMVAAGILEGRLLDLAPGYGNLLFTTFDPMAPQNAQRIKPGQILAELPADLLNEDRLLAAEKLLPHKGFATTLAASDYLPSGLTFRQQALAAALNGVIQQGDDAALTQLKTCHDRLTGHHLYPTVKSTLQDAWRMACRLAQYWLRRQPEPEPGFGTAYEPAESLAQAYVNEGGFIDWARSVLRAAPQGEANLDQAMRALLKSIDTLRQQDDQRFAEALLAWHQSGKQGKRLCPIAEVSQRFIGDFMADINHPMLVILMDGMSWCNAVQLLHKLENEQWLPIRWRPKSHRHLGYLPPVIAELPTITKISRAAFFAGRADTRTINPKTGDDIKRWSRNTKLLKAIGEGGQPDLFLRGQLTENGQQLSNKVRKSIQNTQNPVVAVVVNTLDENLKGSDQVLLDYSAEQTRIVPLEKLLEAAAEAERVVLLASDHGHVLGESMVPHQQPISKHPENGARWRCLADDEPVYPFEMVLPDHLWRPKGVHRVAAIWDDQVRHSGYHYGEHGGLSQAEVVTPTILLAPEWLAQLKGPDLPDLATHPHLPPAWWDLDKPVKLPTHQATTHTPVRQKLAQAALPLDLPTPAAPAPQSTEHHPLVVAFEKSPIFKTSVRDELSPSQCAKLLTYLDILLKQGPQLDKATFARSALIRPHRVPGMIASLGVLNLDGYAILNYEHKTDQVTLDVELLKQQYGLTP